MEQQSQLTRALTRREEAQLELLKRNTRIGYRAEIILLAAEAYKPSEIAYLVRLSDVNTRKWIARYNKLGIRGLAEKRRGGRRLTYDLATRRRIVKLILTPPRELGVPLSSWSLRHFQRFLVAKRVVKAIGLGTLHRILATEGITWKKTKRAMVHRDLHYEAKRRKIMRLLKQRPPYSVVFFFDEKGPMGIKRYGGYAWTRQRRVIPHAQHVRGKLSFFVAYNPHTDKLICKAYERKTHHEFVTFLRFLAARYRGTIYLILDNCPMHYAKRVKETLDEIKRIVFIPTARYAPEMNWVERKLLDMQREVFDNAEFASTSEMRQRVEEWVRFHNGEYEY